MARPTALGGTISVADSTELAALDPDGLPIGTSVFNADVGHKFTLTVSTADLDPDVVVAVSGITGSRWILDTSDSEVQSVTAQTANAIDDADPRNPVVLNATTTNAGTMSAADKAIVNGLDRLSAWGRAMANFIAPLCPQLTAFEEQKLGQYSLGGINAATGSAATASMVGGGITAANTSYTVLGTDVIQNGKVHFAFAYRGILAVTIAGRTATLGLINSAASNLAGVQSEFDTDATHYVLRFQSLTDVSDVVNDGLIHNFAVIGDGTNIKLYIDGVDSGASITQSSVSTEAMAGAIQNTATGNAKAGRFLYAYIEP